MTIGKLKDWLTEQGHEGAGVGAHAGARWKACLHGRHVRGARRLWRQRGTAANAAPTAQCLECCINSIVEEAFDFEGHDTALWGQNSLLETIEAVALGRLCAASLVA